MTHMDLSNLGQSEQAQEEQPPAIEGYVLIDDLPPGTSGEQLMRDRMRAAGPDWDSISVMLVVDERDGNPIRFMNAGIALAGNYGMLQWSDMPGRKRFVPSKIHNSDREGRIFFRHATGVMVPLYATLKAPISLVYEAIDELLVTRTRPSCVDWEVMRE